jgi:hypothetical protein
MTDRDVRANLINRVRARLAGHRDEGAALIAMILLATVMSMIASVIIFDSTTELSRSSTQLDKSTALQAGQSGIDDYVAKMAEDNLYYFHYVNRAEPLRVGSTGTGTYTWTGGTTWSYGANARRWTALGTTGFEYSIKITPPSSSDNAVTIEATGRKANDTVLGNWRTIQTKVRGSSVADYQMVADANISYGSTATTNGRIYTTGNLNHDGTATADLLAEGAVTGGVNMVAPGAGKPVPKKYDWNTSPDIRSQIDQPVDFNTFTTSISTVASVATNDPSGISLNASGYTWKLVFHTGSPKGKVDIYRCGAINENSATGPTGCVSNVAGAGLNKDVPDLGAIYSAQEVLVSGVVQGRVTIASEDNIYIGGNITYNTTGQDILGLIARGSIIVPEFAIPDGTDLTWYSATVAQTGQWRQGTLAGGKATLNFYGSTATKGGGYMSPMFNVRNYNYDLTLLYLQPPFFPVISVNYQVLLFREVVPAP